ncbi:MAG: polysaccharide pyruvyl transferase family protein [Clostridia bacterium]|nr:polysaccharide pyruvyl transferase family protein [Clostridia bacterium]
MAKKKILVYAFLSNNVGDDLFVKTLCERYPQADFYISKEAERCQALREIDNLKPSLRVLLGIKMIGLEAKLYNKGIRTSLLTRCAGLLLHDFEASVFIAGSVFVQKGKVWAGGVRRQLQRASLTKEYMIVSANFGPYTEPGYRDDYQACFEKLTDVCFRDSYSKAQFPESRNVRWAPDAIFTVQPHEKPEKKKAMISVLWCARPRRPAALQAKNDAYEQRIAEMASCLQKKGYETCFVSFCADQKDNEVARRIYDRCVANGDDHASVLEYTGDLNGLLDAFAESECVIASRFHAMILGWIHGKRVMPLCYDDKMRHVLDDLPFYKGYDILNIDQVDAQEAVEAMLSLPRPECSEIVERAQAQFAALDARMKR